MSFFTMRFFREARRINNQLARQALNRPRLTFDEVPNFEARQALPEISDMSQEQVNQARFIRYHMLMILNSPTFLADLPEKHKGIQALVVLRSLTDADAFVQIEAALPEFQKQPEWATLFTELILNFPDNIAT